MADLWDVFRRFAGLLTIAALLAASGVIITAVTSQPTFRSEAVVTTLFDDDDGSAVGFEFSTTNQISAPGLNLLVARPRGQVFPLILGSQRVSRAVLSGRYRYQGKGGEKTTDLYGYLGTSNGDAAEIILKTRIAGFYLDPRTGATLISVDTQSPELSRQIVEKYISALETTLNEMREHRIRTQLFVINEKLVAARGDLHDRESRLNALRSRNRDYASFHDPVIYLQQLQLERDIRLSETIMLALKTQFELTMSRLLDRQGRLTVVTAPVLATSYIHPQWNRTVSMAAIAAFLFFMLAACGLLILETSNRRRSRHWKSISRVISSDFRRCLALSRLYKTADTAGTAE